MATNDEALTSKEPTTPKSRRWRNRAIEGLVFVVLAVLGFALASSILGEGGDEELEATAHNQPMTQQGLYEATSRRERTDTGLSPIFTPSVQYWAPNIVRWSAQMDVDPNLVATVMQIESCGWSDANSVAGAQGLFQVMPFHFEQGEVMTDPDTNAARGIAYLHQGLNIAEGHAGLALAGYNGGHGLITRDYSTWPSETQRYYRWGTGIYREASAGWESSPTLTDWLNAGGASLCATAESTLNIR